MSKILVIFGSRSDEPIYKKIVQKLKSSKIKCDLRILSAHRTPDEVDELIKKDDFSLVIAGAGLSAALPGVVASKTLKPVIGIPVSGNYAGLDALLSIMQMPPGIPVLAVGVEKTDVAAEQAKLMLTKYESITLIGDEDNAAVKKATALLDELEVNYSFSEKSNPNTVNIEFAYFDEPIEPKEDLVIYCPLLEKEDDNAEEALNILKHSNHGLWVGVNRGENAAIAALQILGINWDLDTKLVKLREKGRQKVLKDDAEVKL